MASLDNSTDKPVCGFDMSLTPLVSIVLSVKEKKNRKTSAKTSVGTIRSGCELQQDKKKLNDSMNLTIEPQTERLEITNSNVSVSDSDIRSNYLTGSEFVESSDRAL